MERINDQTRLTAILAAKEGFLKNSGTSAAYSTWHRVATLKPQQGFCGTSIMKVKPGGYTKYFVAAQEEVPPDDSHCPSCWSEHVS